MAMLKAFFKDQKGTTAIEYALIATLIGVALVGVLTAVGSSTTITLKNITGYF